MLSGGERARLVLAGLLLEQHNVLVLDEPGNHLDVETVEALADALMRYPGTVIFTSHDRHFMQRVSTAVIEVREGRVASYPGSYEDYVYRVHKELEAGLRAEHATYNAGATQKPSGEAASASGPRRPRTQTLRPRRTRPRKTPQVGVERKIAKLDDEKKGAQRQADGSRRRRGSQEAARPTRDDCRGSRDAGARMAGRVGGSLDSARRASGSDRRRDLSIQDQRVRHVVAEVSNCSNSHTTFFVFGSISITCGFSGPAWQLPMT